MGEKKITPVSGTKKILEKTFWLPKEQCTFFKRIQDMKRKMNQSKNNKNYHSLSYIIKRDMDLEEIWNKLS